MRRDSRRDDAARRPRVLAGDNPGGARLCASRCAPHLLVRMAHHPRRPRRVLAEAQDPREGLQVEAARRIFASDTRWTVVRGSDLEEGESQGLPVWSSHVGDPILESNITRRVDFALFMVEALSNDELVHKAPAIVGRQTPSALAYAA